MEVVGIGEARRKHKGLPSTALSVHLSGTLMVRMDDGTLFGCKPGDISAFHTGHDAWVIGSEPAAVIDFQGMTEYAKGAK